MIFRRTSRLARMAKPAAACVVALTVAAGSVTTFAQRRGFGGGFGGRSRREEIRPNTPYDGRFTFVRVRYGPDYGFASQGLPWSHDYPAGEQHFMKILNELSMLNPHTEETNILTFDSPDLFKYPVAYLCEPGGWVMSDQEAAGLRAYLRKGGFMIVDDFRFQHWGNFETQMLRVLPEARFFDLDISHPIFHTFFEIKTLDVPQYLRSAAGDLPRDLRGQRSIEADHGDDQLQHRHLGILGMVGHRPEADRRVERGVQGGRQLRHLRNDALKRYRVSRESGIERRPTQDFSERIDSWLLTLWNSNRPTTSRWPTR